MRHYRHAVDSSRSHVRSLWGVVSLLSVLNIGLCIALIRAQSDLTIHIPPDLKDGAEVAVNSPLNANIYAFASYIFQQLNRWPNDGSTDFSQAIFALSAYLTPTYRESLISNLEDKGVRGELASRERGLSPIPGEGYAEHKVHVLGAGTWLTYIDMELTESVKGVTVKQKRLRYPIRVIRYDVDREANPWGLALDGYVPPGPQELPNIETQ